MRNAFSVIGSILAILILGSVVAIGQESAQDTAVLISTADSVSLEETVDAADRPFVYTLYVDGAIGTVTNERIKEAIELAEENDADLLVIMLDTPGGFTRSTWSICKNILNANVPVCMYIAPSGSRAGSAGVYMTYAAHIAAMAPSTNIGAAHPVGGEGKEIDSVMNEKVTNDAVAQIRAAAEERGRNAEWAEKAVRESVSITDRDALEKNVIDLRAENMDDLLRQLEGRKIKLPKGEVTLSLKNAVVEELEITFVDTILKLISSPDIAFILFSIGGLGLVLELYNPGAILPGVVGAISMILAFYSFQTLPINYAGVALILFAIMLFIAEIKVVSHGVLTVGGLISLFFGGLMLVDTVDPNLKVSISVLVTVVVTVGVLVGLASWLVIKAARSQPFIGQEGMLGKTAMVKPNGMVYVDGALWKAEPDDELTVGNKVTIVAVEGLVLKVKNKNVNRQGGS